MNILLVSPMVIPVNPETRYAGIESLVYHYAKELVKEHEVSVIGRKDSVYPEGVKVYGVNPRGDLFLDGELLAYQSYQYLLRTFDVIHDFSHQHFACRYNYKLPALNIFWHAPSLAKYPKAPYNIIGLSKWACREFKRVYKQEARYMQSILIDPEVYHPEGERGDRFLTLGIMNPEKGNLPTALLCKELGLPLDIAGKGDGGDYEKAVRAVCDGELIKYHGEVTDEEKIKLMQTCKALMFIMPQGYEEVTSHKLQEAMFCGAPVIVSNTGVMAELVFHGVDGFRCNTEAEFKIALKEVDNLKPDFKDVVDTYSAKNVIKNHIELYEKVKEGLHW